jgi:hypothetical protein
MVIVVEIKNGEIEVIRGAKAVEEEKEVVEIRDQDKAVARYRKSEVKSISLSLM